MKTVLILGAGIMQVPSIRIAKKLGWRTIVADANPQAVEETRRIARSLAPHLPAANFHAEPVALACDAMACAIAEVGAVMIVGGNIDGVTRVMTTTIALVVFRRGQALISHVGEDCAGAVQIVRPERLAAVLAPRRPEVAWLAPRQIGEELGKLSDHPYLAPTAPEDVEARLAMQPRLDRTVDQRVVVLFGLQRLERHGRERGHVDPAEQVVHHGVAHDDHTLQRRLPARFLRPSWSRNS